MPRYLVLSLLIAGTSLATSCVVPAEMPVYRLPDQAERVKKRPARSFVPVARSRAPREIPLAEVAALLSCRVKIDLSKGTRRLVGSAGMAVIAPGSPVAEVNGAKVQLSSPVMWRGGELRGPSDLGDSLLEAFAAHPRRVSAPAKAAAPLLASASAPGLPRGWDFPATRRWKYIVIHHSATSKGCADSFHRSHKAKWRWGLGYHFVIGNGSLSGLGEVEIGPRWELQNKGVHGAHAGSNTYNKEGIGVCLVGDFSNRTGPSAPQLKALTNLCRALMRRYGISRSQVLRHREVRRGHTECPGAGFPWSRFKAGL